MVNVTKATDAEKLAYRGCYPLHGWITVSGQRCAVEWLHEPHNGPKYEVLAPDGYHFERNDGVLHSKLCFNLEDLRSRFAGEELEKCGAECDAELNASVRGFAKTAVAEQLKPGHSWCDGCGKQRRDVQPQRILGSDDSLGLCFVCRKEAERERAYNAVTGQYEPVPRESEDS
jgi:hypothetical protein